MTEEQAIVQTKSILDELTRIFYTLFTNKTGQQPDVERIHELFIPEGLIIKNSDTTPVLYNLQQFIEPRIKLLTDGSLIDFSEVEVTERTEIFGNIAHRFSLYRKSGILAGKKFETNGMKTIQFIKTPEGWKISCLAWDDEREGLAIPDKYKP